MILLIAQILKDSTDPFIPAEIYFTCGDPCTTVNLKAVNNVVELGFWAPGSEITLEIQDGSSTKSIRIFTVEADSSGESLNNISF